MIGSLRKHQSWIWILAIPVIIVSFIASDFVMGRSGVRGGDRGGTFGSINGRSIKRDEYMAAEKQAYLQAFLRTGQVPRNEQDFDRMGMNLRREILNRILIEEAVRHYRIEIDRAATAKFLRNMLVGEKNALDLATYKQIITQISSKIPGITDADLERFARSEVSRLHLAAVFGAPGALVTPAEVEENFRRAHEDLVVEAAFVSQTNFLAQVPADPIAVSNYFSLNQAFYNQKEQRSASYVFLPLTNFYAEADAQLGRQTNLALIVENRFTQLGTNALTDPLTGRQLTKPEALERIRNEFRDSLAGAEARKAGAKLIADIYDAHGEAPYKPGLFEQKAAEAKLTVLNTLPFEAAVGPLGVSAQGFTETTYSLSLEKPVSQRPLLAENGAYVLLLKQVLPPRLLPFDAVRTQVIADFKREESTKLARNAGEKFASTLTNAPASATGFASAAKAAGLTVVKLPKFSLATEALAENPLPIDIRLLKGYASALQPGASSAFVPLQEGGVVLHLVSRQPVDPAKLKEELPAYAQRLREQRVYYSFSEWLNRQATELRLVMPQA